MNEKFEKALKFVLRWEGGYVSDPHDPGGRTNFGITENTLRRARKLGIVDVKNVRHLTEEDAKKIYHELFWKPMDLDEFPAFVAILLFDTAVHIGQWRTTKLLQKTLQNIHKYAKSPRFYVAIDGKLGSRTKGALKEFSQLASEEAKQEFVRLFCTFRLQLYWNRVKNNGKLKRFMKGWLRRVLDLAYVCMREAEDAGQGTA